MSFRIGLTTHPAIEQWAIEARKNDEILLEEIPSACGEDYSSLIQTAQMNRCQVYFMIDGEKHLIERNNESLNAVFIEAFLKQHRIFAEALTLIGVIPEDIEVEVSLLDITQEDSKKNMLLHDAVSLKCYKVINALIAKGASIHALNLEYETPVDVALMRGNRYTYWQLMEPETVEEGARKTTSMDEFLVAQREQLAQAYLEKDIPSQVYYAQKFAYSQVMGNPHSIKTYQMAARYLSMALFIAQSNRLNPRISMHLFHAFEWLERKCLLKIFNRQKPLETAARHWQRRETLSEIREEIKTQLACQKHVYVVQAEMCRNLKQLVRDLIEEAMDDLGEGAETNFGVMLVGATARGEIGPYSLFQCVLVTWNKHTSNYQRFLSFLEFKSILLGETPQSVKIGSGIRQMICPSPNGFRLIKGGYGLSQNTFPLHQDVRCLIDAHKVSRSKRLRLLIHTKHLTGSAEGFQLYRRQVKPFFGGRGSIATPWKEAALKQMQKVLEDYSFRLDFDRIHSRIFDNQKDILEFVHGALDTLALYFRMTRKGRRECIKSLVSRQILSEKGGDNLLFVLRKATEWQLKTQLFYRQDDSRIFIGISEDGVERLFTLNESERKGLVKIYQTLYALQCCLEKFSEGDPTAFATDPLVDPLLGEESEENEEFRIRMAALSPGEGDIFLEKCLEELSAGHDERGYKGIRQIMREFPFNPSLSVLRRLTARLHPWGDVTEEFMLGKAHKKVEGHIRFGIIYRALGETSKALEHLNQAHLLLKKEVRDQGVNALIQLQEALIHTEKGWLHQDLELWEEAFIEHQKAWNCVEKEAKFPSIQLLLQTCLAYASVLSGHTHEGKSLVATAHAIVSGGKIPPSLVFAHAILNLGMTYTRLENTFGLSLIWEATQMARIKKKETFHHFAPFFFWSKVQAHHHLGQTAKTDELCSAFFEAFPTGSPLYYARISEIKGKLLNTQTKHMEASQLFEQAYAIYMSIYGKEHPVTQKVGAIFDQVNERIFDSDFTTSSIDSDDEEGGFHAEAVSIIWSSSADTLSSGISPCESDSEVSRACASSSSSSTPSASSDISPEELFHRACEAYHLNETVKAFEFIDQICTEVSSDHPIQALVTQFLDQIGAVKA